MPEHHSVTAQVCFVDMPFGTKTDSKTGVEIDFDQVYTVGIKPAVEAGGLQCIRGDMEQTGGIIHAAMFARLLLSEFVVADMTTANANVFYELGVRHAAKPYTTIPIFATLSAPPFDVNMVRAIPYDLTDDGKLDEDAAAELQRAIRTRIDSALKGPVAKDSPLFQLFQNFPTIELSHDLTDVFRERIRISEKFQNKLDIAMQSDPPENARQRLDELREELGDLPARTNEVLIKLYLAYRDVEAWDAMISLYEEFPAALKDSTIAQQQLALALNRRKQPGDRDRALRILGKLRDERGESAETNGILGRIYKDQYREAERSDDPAAPAQLDKAIEAYTRGFECEPADYYPGVNAINLLVQKGTAAAQAEIDRLTPLVSFAVARRGGAASDDYWDLATVLELALIGRDNALADSVLGKVLAAANAGWMLKTTADNLDMVVKLRDDEEERAILERAIAALRQKAQALPS